MTEWCLIEDKTVHDGAWNMAVDELLFRDIEEGRSSRSVLRLYGWSPPCLSLGRNQDFARSCDPSYCRQKGIDVVRRPTGGKAVLHADEVTYSVAGSLLHPPFKDLGLTETYGLLAGALAGGLERLGLEVRLNRRKTLLSPMEASPCFLFPSAKELLVEGKKVVGSAQLRGRNAFLQHGAIPLTVDYDVLAMAVAMGPKEAESYPSFFAGIADFGMEVTADVLKKAMVVSFKRVFPGKWEERGLTPKELEGAGRLRSAKYLSVEWTKRQGRSLQKTRE